MDYSRSRRAPFILGIVGKSDTGKSTLILKLIPELVKRGYRVGTIKNCPHGFDIDKKGKDSWRFSQAGSEGILLTSPDRFALVRRGENKSDKEIPELICLLFYGFDIVLVEGYSSLEGIKKIELLRKGISHCMDTSLKKVVALVSDIEMGVDKPVFRPDEVNRIVDFMEEAMQTNNINKGVEILINGESLPLNHFVQRMVKNLALAVVEPLKKNSKEDITEVIIKVSEFDK